MNKNSITVFNNPDFGQIRAMVQDDEPWFVGKDVAEKLGYAKPLNAIAMHVDEDDSLKQGLIDSMGRTQQTTFINESGVYALILASKLPQAKEFKHWVTAEVLPQIRKTGCYVSDLLRAKDELLEQKSLLLEQQNLQLIQKDEQLAQKSEILREKNMQLLAQAPNVRFAAEVTASDDSILIRDLAKLITQNGVKIGQGRMFYWLRLNGYIFQHETRPIQEWVERGIFETNERILHMFGRSKFSLTTKVTGKGQKYFLEGFLSGKFKADNQSFF